MKKFTIFGLSMLLFVSFMFPLEIKLKNFQIDFYGGVSTLNPADLNLRSEFDEKTDRFYNDGHFDYRASQNSNFSYRKIESGDYPRIKNAFLMGLRIKYYLSRHIGFSVGFQRLSRKLTKDVINQYAFPYDYGEFQYRCVYLPYTLSVQGYIPSFGLHFRTPLKGLLAAGGFLEVGPVFANCAYTLEYTEEWISPEGNLLDKSSPWFIEEKGKGTGYALDAGLRIFIDLGKLFPFIESSYAYQKIKSLSGHGFELIDFLERTWEGEWGIRQGTASSEWGDLTYERPSNYWDGSISKHRDFTLDLSGFQFRIGISYRF